tara:strand:+ start:1154 stop:1306 length:153 start_codon:yes stop_codon:yes gene_type:complete
MRAFLSLRATSEDHTKSIINKPPEPAWLKELAEIDMGLTATFTVKRAELY